MTIAKRLILLLALPLIVLLGLGVFTRLQLTKIESRSRFVSESRIPSLAVLGAVSRGFAEMRVNVRSFLLATNQAGQSNARLLFDEDEKDVVRLLQQYGDTLITDEKDRRLWSDYRDMSRTWLTGAKQVMALTVEGQRGEAVTLLTGPVAELGVRLSKASNEWIQHNEAVATTGRQRRGDEH